LSKVYELEDSHSIVMFEACFTKSTIMEIMCYHRVV